MPDEIQVTGWGGPGQPGEQAILARFAAEDLQPYQWSNDPGDVYAPHAHDDHKVLYVAAGSITFSFMDCEPVTLRAGDRLDIPPGVIHSAVVGREGVACLEAYRR